MNIPNWLNPNIGATLSNPSGRYGLRGVSVNDFDLDNPPYFRNFDGGKMVGHKRIWHDALFVAECNGSESIALAHLTAGKCRCGINALYTTQSTLNAFGYDVDALIVAQLGGTITVDKHGFRAQYGLAEIAYVRNGRLTPAQMLGLLWRYSDAMRVIVIDDWASVPHLNFTPTDVKGRLGLTLAWQRAMHEIASIPRLAIEAQIRHWAIMQSYLSRIDVSLPFSERMDALERVLQRQGI